MCVLCKDGLILREQQPGSTSAYKCVQPSSVDTRTSVNECGAGCASCTLNGQCLWCNHYLGFYMSDRYSCAKQASIHALASLLCLIAWLVVAE